VPLNSGSGCYGDKQVRFTVFPSSRFPPAYWPFVPPRYRRWPGTADRNLRAPHAPEPPALTAPPSLPAVGVGTSAFRRRWRTWPRRRARQ